MPSAHRRTEPEEEVPHDAPTTVAPYVRAIGVEKTVELLLKFGGSEIYLATAPRGESQLAALIGLGCVKALGREFGRGSHVHVPFANAWMVRQLKARGWSTSEISRALRLDDSTVRRYTRRAGPDPNQPRFL